MERFLLGVPGELGGCEGPATPGCEPGRGDALLEAVLRVERKVEAIQHIAAGQPPVSQTAAEDDNGYLPEEGTTPDS